MQFKEIKNNILRVFIISLAAFFLVLSVPGALRENTPKAEALTSCANPAVTYCQELWGTGKSGSINSQTKLNGNTGSNGLTDSHWELNRIYSDAGIPNGTTNGTMCQAFSFPNIGTTPATPRVVNEQGGRAQVFPLTFRDEPPTAIDWIAPNYTHSAWSGPGELQWLTSNRARWIGLNRFGWHDGWGLGKNPWPAPTPCSDPSINTDGSFPGFDNWHTYVFRYTAATAAIPANVDLSSLHLEFSGMADNHFGVTVNGQPLNIACPGVMGALYGQGDPNGSGSRYLPMCTPGFEGEREIMSGQRFANTFVTGNNRIEIHVKSAYSSMGLFLSEFRIVGNVNGAPTCSSVSFTRGGVATASVPAGAAFRTLATFNNPAFTNLSVSNVSYNIAGMPVPGSANTSGSYNNPGDIPLSGSRGYGSPYPPDTIIIPQAGTYTVTWTIQSANGTVSCSGNITVTTQAPTCDASTIVFYSGGVATSSVPVGQAFRTQVTIANLNPLPMTVSSVRYSIAGAPAGDPNISNFYNNPGDIPANSSRGYSSNQTPEDIRISAAGSYTVTWSITVGGVTTTCGTDTITVTILPPTCTASSKNVIVGLPFDISASVTNPNNFAPVTITGPANKFTLLTAPNQTGGASPATPVVIAGAGNTGFTSPATLVVNTAGIYTVNWSFTTAVGNANCSAIVTASNQPYARFYGNDVVAGGSFKSAGVCAPAGPAANITMPSAYKPATPTNHTTFVGSGSELGVVATGAIRGLLPGSQVTGRGSVGELAFANNVAAAPVGAGTREFGGGFNETLCLEELPTTAAAPVVGPVDLNTLASGTYQAASLTINASTISDSKKLTIIVSGDVIIDGAITYAGSGSWASIGAIPLVRIYANNISVVGGVPTLDGLYVARNNFYTCTQNNGSIFASIANANNADDGPYLTACTNKLTVNGAVIAKDIYLHRAIGNVGGATTTVAEGASDPDIAESFNFSPELYLALLAEGTGNLNGRFDSILSLPPAF